MSYIAAAPEFGLIIRKAALTEKDISGRTLTEAVHDIDLIAENDDLLTFGPLFGDEAFQTIMRRLELIGLTYVDDYFGLDVLVPPWVGLGVSLVR